VGPLVAVDPVESQLLQSPAFGPALRSESSRSAVSIFMALPALLLAVRHRHQGRQRLAAGRHPLIEDLAHLQRVVQVFLALPETVAAVVEARQLIRSKWTPGFSGMTSRLRPP